MDRETSIISQNAGTTAANLLGTAAGLGLLEANDLAGFMAAFSDIRNSVFQETLSMAGNEVVAVAFTGGPSTGVAEAVQQSVARPGEAGSRPYANTVVKFGKFKDNTIAGIDAIPVTGTKKFDDSGHSWLLWAADNATDGGMKKAIAAYLAA